MKPDGKEDILAAPGREDKTPEGAREALQGGMNSRQSYNLWAATYDADDNKTRDLEAKALRETLEHISFDTVLEIGSGTGKNSRWLAERSKRVVAVDLSEGMLAVARGKDDSDGIAFVQADIREPWPFAAGQFDLVAFSLVLEHIEDLDHVFEQAADKVKRGGHVYVGELHPFKQYAGTKARFDTTSGQHILLCFNHNLSDFTRRATGKGFKIERLDEYFDNSDRASLPRILALLLRRA
jgi:ubiquinone/menaquinone biosynthesis C-methylase UbiE